MFSVLESFLEAYIQKNIPNKTGPLTEQDVEAALNAIIDARVQAVLDARDRGTKRSGGWYGVAQEQNQGQTAAGAQPPAATNDTGQSGVPAPPVKPTPTPE